MRKEALMKDFRMEIRKSLNRFISIFFIVALGVSFFAGVRAAEPDMRYSGDVYFDAREMMDLKVLSTLGLTDGDIQAISEIEGVKKVEPAYMIDVLAMVGESERIVHVESLLETMNQVDIAEGRLPETTTECVVDMDMAASANIQIGDVLTFYSGTDKELSETLIEEAYTVVGTCSSPMYISFDRGSTNIGNGEISMFVYVLDESFCQEVYSQAYVAVEGAKEALAFTDEYRAIVEEVQEKIEGISDERCSLRYVEIMNEANEEISEAEKELNDAKDEAEEELADAKDQLIDGENAIEDGRSELSQAEDELEAARKKLEESRKTLDEGWAEYNQGVADLENGKQQIADAEAEIAANEQRIAEAEAEIAANEPLIIEAEKAIAEAEVELNANEAKILEAEEGLRQAKELIAGLESGWKEYEAGLEQLEYYKNLKVMLEYAVNMNVATQEQIAQLQQLQEAISQAEAELAAAKIQLEEYEALRPQAEEAIAREAEIVAARQTFDAAKAEFEAKKAEVVAGRQQIEAAKVQIEDGKRQIAEAKALISEKKQEIIEGEAALESAYKQLVEGEAAYEEGMRQLEAGRAEIAEAYATIAQNSQKIADGWAEYEAGKKEAEEKIFDAQIKIQDAKNEIAGIDGPSWYVNNREDDTDYVGYSDNADRMGAIGKVFPILFFLVAALVSLTTMTRMVEENRMQIGTLKALGYSKFWIAFKYVGYALLATLGGSIVGVLFGQKAFPWIIVNAYKILYIHIPDVVIPYHMGYALMGTFAAVACTMAATVSSCYKALMAHPAALMRPEAPRVGKKVFLEYIPGVWSRMSFTWKSTVRNLMRYKKRFFMTIFGIGGCMALMLVGYGIKDSITDVSVLQFGKIQIYDMMTIVDEDMSDEDRAELEKQLDENTHISGYVEGYMRLTEMSAANTKKDIYLYVPSTLDDLEQFITFNHRKTGETWTLEEDSIVLTEKVARDLKLGKGDEIELKLSDDTYVTVEITDVCENYLAHYIYMSPKMYEEIAGSNPKNNTIFVTVPDHAQDDLEAVGTSLLANDNVLAVSYVNTMAQDMNDMLGVLDSVIVILIVAAGMLAFVVLYNLNNININERKRELATLKVLGFYNSEVGAYVYRENILLTFIGSGLGVVLGKLLHGFIIKTVEVEQTMFGLTITTQSYLWSIGFTFLFSLIVNGVMYFKLKKIDMVESLKSVE